MTPEEINALEALVKAAPRLHMSFDDGVTDDKTGEQGKPAALYDVDGDWIADFDCGMLPKPQADAIGRSLAALHTAAPALIAAAREVERLRAFVPRWEPTDKIGGLRLRLGTLTLASIARNWDGLWFYRLEVERTDYPTAEDAARAVCARLNIPYVPVEVDDG